MSTPVSSRREPPGLDDQSQRWIERLQGAGAQREAAIGDLYELLLRAARFEVYRRRGASRHGRGDHDDIARQSADDALVAILGKLGDFRGDSRFTTWAYKFALYETAANVRKLAWQGREVLIEAEAWPQIADVRSSPERAAEVNDQLGALREAIDADLTPHQREVLVALALNEVPIDVLAERLSTTRGALYKTLHDARQKLRASLSERDLRPDNDEPQDHE